MPGYRIEMSPFGGVKDSGLGYKEGVIEAMKSYTTVKTYSLPWLGQSLPVDEARRWLKSILGVLFLEDYETRFR